MCGDEKGKKKLHSYIRIRRPRQKASNKQEYHSCHLLNEQYTNAKGLDMVFIFYGYGTSLLNTSLMNFFRFNNAGDKNAKHLNIYYISVLKLLTVNQTMVVKLTKVNTK